MASCSRKNGGSVGSHLQTTCMIELMCTWPWVGLHWQEISIKDEVTNVGAYVGTYFPLSQNKCHGFSSNLFKIVVLMIIGVCNAFLWFIT